MDPDIAAQVTKFAILFVSCAVVALFIVGATNRVIVFNDFADFCWTIGIPIGMAITLAVVAVTEPEHMEPGFFTTDAFGIFVRVVCLLGTLVAVCTTFGKSIKANGWLIGPIMFIFKLAASTILILLILGQVEKFIPNDKEENGGPSITAMIFHAIIGALLGWLLARLINGDAVRARNRERLESYV